MLDFAPDIGLPFKNHWYGPKPGVVDSVALVEHPPPVTGTTVGASGCSV